MRKKNGSETRGLAPKIMVPMKNLIERNNAKNQQCTSKSVAIRKYTSNSPHIEKEAVTTNCTRKFISEGLFY
ncbi:hypothetical protein KIS4809_1329 [Bacillus sp. ZZV12-4809]|nr:hypothetical protein KIS4809_1329 [Bacillus sp. ZZV12-4809]